MAEFFVSNANKADQEIQAAKADMLKAGLDKINPSNSDMGDNSVEDEIYKAALNAYNDEEKQEVKMKNKIYSATDVRIFQGSFPVETINQTLKTKIEKIGRAHV